MGEKENSVPFTCCLHKERLAGDKNRFQTLSAPLCGCNVSVLRTLTKSDEDMGISTHTRNIHALTPETNSIRTRAYNHTSIWTHTHKDPIFTLKSSDNRSVRATMKMKVSILLTLSLLSHC